MSERAGPQTALPRERQRAGFEQRARANASDERLREEPVIS
ncbi:MAG: hypothetical protein JWN95_2074 [Frankiales bacterium]|nr:hypothetical protein [Frankiales bacterium]